MGIVHHYFILLYYSVTTSLKLWLMSYILRHCLRVTHTCIYFCLWKMQVLLCRWLYILYCKFLHFLLFGVRYPIINGCRVYDSTDMVNLVKRKCWHIFITLYYCYLL